MGAGTFARDCRSPAVPPRRQDGSSPQEHRSHRPERSRDIPGQSPTPIWRYLLLRHWRTTPCTSSGDSQTGDDDTKRADEKRGVLPAVASSVSPPPLIEPDVEERPATSR